MADQLPSSPAPTVEPAQVWQDEFGRVLLQISGPFAPSKYLLHMDLSQQPRQCGKATATRAALQRAHFASLWDSLYGTWAENPWVWALTFQRITT